MPIVSIIIPCYNYGHLLGETLDSVLAQTLQDWEAIIVDDGSTDNSREVAEKYCKKDSRFRYVFQENAGLSAARNKGLDLATGDYIQFLDADDYLFPEKFKIQISAIKENGAQIAICNYHKSSFENLNEIIAENFHRVKFDPSLAKLEFLFNWERSLSIPVHCFLTERSLIESGAYRFLGELKNHEDIHFWLRIVWEQPNFCFQDEVLAVYRKTLGGISKNIKKMRAGYAQAIHLFATDRPLTDLEKELITRKLNLIQYWLPSKSELLAKMIRPIKKWFGKNLFNDFFYSQEWADKLNSSTRQY